MEVDPKKMEDNLKKNEWKTTSKKKWKKNQSTKINLVGCDTIVNSPSHCFQTPPHQPEKYQ
jgi:hypothetical protein